MRKIRLLTGILLSCFLLSSCGTKKASDEPWRGIAPEMEDLSAVTNRTEYYDLTVESEPLFGQGDESGSSAYGTGGGYRHLGTQFLMGEPVQLRAVVSFDKADIYLCHKDGNSERVLQDVPGSFIGSFPRCQWYLDREENFYCIRKSYYIVGADNANKSTRQDATITKLLPSGEILYETPLPTDINIGDILQTEDGRVYVLLQDELDYTQILAEIDPATGKLLEGSRMETDYDSYVYLGSAGSSLTVTGYGRNSDREIMKASLTDKSYDPILYFNGTSYGWHNDREMGDFRVMEDGSIELLWTESDGSGSFLERLRMEKVEKIPLVCRGPISGNSWLGEQIARFNRENSDYHIVLEDCGMDNDIQDFARLTSIQMGAGKGPDILYGDFMEDYMDGLLEKGALEELNPWMEASGIHEEDYFPSAFSTWRQGERIYSVNYWVPIQYFLMDEEVLGSVESPDMETLADALLSWEGNGVWQKGLDSSQVLNWFLEGSDNLGGIVDWEAGSSNFHTPLFGKLLEVARRYGDDGSKNVEAGICERVPIWNLFFFKWQKEREASGRVLCGTLFDDGCYASSLPSFTMAINANSSHKEGAWEFISLLLGEEAQSADMDSLKQPVHRKSFEDWLQEKLIFELTTKHKKDGADYTPAYYGEDTSEGKLAEYRQTIQDARPLPLRTRPILRIIQEEAEDYFNGSKSVEEVAEVISNRVQLYLDERK